MESVPKGVTLRTPSQEPILEEKLPELLRNLMVVYARLAASDEERAHLFEILNKPWSHTTSADISWVHNLYRRTEAREQAEEMAENLINQAVEYLWELPETAAKYRFLRLSKYLTRRIH